MRQPGEKWERKMKRIECLAVVLTGILLTGCASGERASTAPAASGGQWVTAASQPSSADASSASGSMSSEQVLQESRDLTEDEVLAVYDRAVVAYGWFNLSTMPSSGPMVFEGETGYQRVTYAGIGTLDELKTYLQGLFAMPLINQLLPPDAPVPQYRDINGELYVVPSSRERDADKGAVTAQVEKQSSTSYLVDVTVQLLGENLHTVTGAEFYSFPYEQIDGRWVFTAFDLVY